MKQSIILVSGCGIPAQRNKLISVFDGFQIPVDLKSSASRYRWQLRSNKIYCHKAASDEVQRLQESLALIPSDAVFGR